MRKFTLSAVAVAGALSFAGAAKAGPMTGAGSLATVIDATAVPAGVSELAEQVQYRRYNRRHYRHYRPYAAYGYRPRYRRHYVAPHYGYYRRPAYSYRW